MSKTAQQRVNANIASENKSAKLGKSADMGWGMDLDLGFDFSFGAKFAEFNTGMGNSFVRNYFASRGDRVRFNKSLSTFNRYRDFGLSLFATDGTSLTVQTQESVDQAVKLQFGDQYLDAKVGYTNENNYFSANSADLTSGTCFLGGSAYDQVSHAGAYGESYKMNMENSSSIEVVDNSQSQSDDYIVTKSNENQTVLGGGGNTIYQDSANSNNIYVNGNGATNLLWGGSGTTYATTDVLYNMKNSDVISYQGSLGDIAFIGQTEQGVELTKYSGERLIVANSGADNVTFYAAENNTSYTYNKSSATWFAS